MGLELRPYQEVAVDHLHRNPRAGLFLDMGLGKTAVTLRALRPENLPVLVVAPKRVAENVWAEEVRLWRPDLSIAVAAGSPQQRAQQLTSGKDIVVIGRDNLGDVVNLGKQFPWKTFVLDELSGFKSWKSQRFKAAKIISRRAKTVWGLTGTPSPNGLLDLWSQVYILDQGERLGKFITHYRNRYFYPGQPLPNGVIPKWHLRDGADSRIHTKIEDICLSMSNEGLVDLPPVSFNDVKVPMDAKTKRLYKILKKDLVLGVQLIGTIHSADTAAALSSKLSQLSAGFLYADQVLPPGTPPPANGKYSIVHWEKIRTVAEIIEGTGSPVMVMYRFRAEKEMLLKELPRLGHEVHTMEEKDVVQNWNAGLIPVLLTHPASAGHGLNLQFGGHTMIWTTMPWSLEEWQQANARLPRSGQTQPVVIHRLMTPGAIDSAILAALSEKTTIQDALLEHLESPI